MRVRLLTVWVCGVISVAASSAPRPRPVDWAQPVLGSSLENLFRVCADLYRSEQPGAGDVADLHALGIRSVLTLRDHPDGGKLKAGDGFECLQVPMRAGKVDRVQLAEALRAIRDAPKPVLIHCWHGSDRTGVVVAAYRIVFEQWSHERAIDELKNGGFGYHARLYKNLVSLLETIDGKAWRAELGLP
jgi:tyrosine-protein phosphatase SIW14